MGSFIKGQVVVVEFPFSDLSDFKKRPALVICQLSRDDAIVCQITSKGSFDGYSIELLEKDFTRGKLDQPSNIRPNRLFTVDTKIIDKTVAFVTQEKMDEVMKKIIEIIS